MTIHERLRAIKRDGATLELEMIHAAQVGERCISRDVAPTEAELELVEQSLRAHRAVLAAVRTRWEARAAAALPALVLQVVDGGGA